ncbi:hypothetical protein AGMMS49525_05290 [Bacteroidia bacterium]|nr:hypothetical protein AGMMS49525_05290 [Bacteroidia bacterium]
MLKRIIFIFIAVILCGTSVAQKTHIVVKGENLGRISETYHVKIDSIKKWNNLKGENINIGKKLIVGQKTTALKSSSDTSAKANASATQPPTGTVAGSRGSNKRDDAQTFTQNSSQNQNSNLSKEEESSLWWLWLLLGCGGGILVWETLLRVILPFFNRKETQNNQDYIRQLQDDKKELKSKIEELNKKISTLEKQNKNFLEENIEMGRSPQRNDGQNDKCETSATTLYADAIIDGFLNRVKETPNEDTIFELHLQNAQTATFTVYQSAYQRIIANPSFLEGCDKQVLNNAQKVEIASKGTTQRDADGRWKIIHKLNVIIK